MKMGKILGTYNDNKLNYLETAKVFVRRLQKIAQCHYLAIKLPPYILSSDMIFIISKDHI